MDFSWLLQPQDTIQNVTQNSSLKNWAEIVSLHFSLCLSLCITLSLQIYSFSHNIILHMPWKCTHNPIVLKRKMELISYWDSVYQRHVAQTSFSCHVWTKKKARFPGQAQFGKKCDYWKGKEAAKIKRIWWLLSEKNIMLYKNSLGCWLSKHWGVFSPGLNTEL